MKLVLAQINPTIGMLAENANSIIGIINDAKKQETDIVVFPELSISGYPPEDLLLLPHFIRALDEQLARIITHTDGIIALIGTVRGTPEEGLYNSAAIIDNGTLIGFQDKTLLPTYDVFDEHRYFTPAQKNTPWTLGGKTIAIMICEDIWHHDHAPVTTLQDHDLDLLINLSASPFSANKPRFRTSVCATVAKKLQCPVVLCNQVGANDSLIFDGHSIHVAGDGTVVAQAKGFETDTLIIDTKETTPSSLPFDPTEEIYNALVLGIRDYFSKQHFSRACLGLSGGIDSALVACLAADALGAENVTALIMPSRYSNPASIADAEQLVTTVGMPYHIISIEAPFQCYLDLLAPIFEGEKNDTTEENLQARIRGMLLMAYSNKHGHIVLSTGNKSEMAMGYCTLYGDMCGGLGVINDVSKTQVYAMTQWIHDNKTPIPHGIIDRPPSAELAPDQKDSDSLPEYDIVDAVLQEYVGYHHPPEQIATLHNIPLHIVQQLIQKIHTNEYKRRQAPPGLRVSTKSFSKGRIFPIVQRWA